MPESEMTGDTDMKCEGNEEEAFIDLDHYRKLVRSYIDMRRYKTALFWAEKVVTLSNYDPKDVYWEAQCMFLLKEYHRAAYIIKLRGLEKTNLCCHYLAVESLLEAKEYQEAIELLNSVDTDNMSSSIMLGDDSIDQPALNTFEPTKIEILSSIWLLKGKVLEAMDNRTLAMDAYIQALQLSVYCTEALDSLFQHEMLMGWEEQELMSNLPFSQQCSDADAKIIKDLYKSKLKKYFEPECPVVNAEQTPNTNSNTIQSIREMTDKIKNARTDEIKLNKRTSKFFTPDQRNILSPANKILYDLKTTPTYSIHNSLSRNSYNQHESIKMGSFIKNKLPYECKTAVPLAMASKQIRNSLDMMVTEAEKLFYNCEYKKCMNILDETFKEDPYHAGGLTVFIGCLVELKNFNKLFYIAHKLVDIYPDQAISWYAVGCYYDMIGKSDPARRYLSKATTLDRLFGPAWLAYGHSFAKENEHDQAMAAYFKATQLMRGCHLPLLYIGVECGLTKNLELAEKFFYQAMSIAPLDVFVLHELGVIKFEYELYGEAEEILRTTLNMVTKMAKLNRESISQRWEPLLNNLGHCCRKNKKYTEALQFHQQALVLKPQTASTYTAIGFVQALMGKLEDAVESLHRSLGIKRDDIFTSALLKYCIEDLMEENELPDNISDTEIVADTNQYAVTKKSGGGPEAEAPVMKTKLKYDDSNSSPNSDTIDNSFDMSMEV